MTVVGPVQSANSPFHVSRMRRGRVVLSDDDNEDDNEVVCLGAFLDDVSLEENFQTPPSSPLNNENIRMEQTIAPISFLSKESRVQVEATTPAIVRTATKAVPKSLSKTGGKLVVRKVQFMLRRLDDLAECALSPDCSFFVAEWSGTEIHLNSDLSKHEHPDYNVEVLLGRVVAVREALAKRFVYVSGVYIGKTGSIPERFNTHRARKSKPDNMLVMIGIALFTPDDVHERDQQRWHMTSDILALQYERLLTERIIADGLETFSSTQEAGGGGRATASTTKNVALYVLFSVSNTL